MLSKRAKKAYGDVLVAFDMIEDAVKPIDEELDDLFITSWLQSIRHDLDCWLGTVEDKYL